MMETPDPQFSDQASPPTLIEETSSWDDNSLICSNTAAGVAEVAGSGEAAAPEADMPMDSDDNPPPPLIDAMPSPTDMHSTEGEAAVEILTDDCVNRLLVQSIGTITLECGYHEAHQASLDILNDVCCDYIKRISTLLRLTTDTEDWRDPECDFVDSLERVFHQVNVPSAANLHQFVCKMGAIKRHDRKAS